MRWSVVHYLLFVCLPLFGAAQFRPDYMFLEKAGGWMKLHQMPLAWQDAQLYCELEGAMLASPTNPYLLQAMEDLISTVSGRRTVFTGIHATFSPGVYFSIDGIPLSEIPVSWAPNEPDNQHSNEECLVLFANGTMGDANCRDPQSFICYRKKTEDMPTLNECGTTDSGYHLESRTGSCYKYHHVARPWSRAFMACAAEGGYLAIANSEDEAQIFKEIYREGPRHTGTSQHKQIVYLGFHLSDELGWKTIHGETLQKAGYAYWAGGEPNNDKSAETNWEGEYCGSIDMGCTKIGLNDLWCGHNQPFICEKKPSRKEHSNLLDLPYLRINPEQQRSSTQLPESSESSTLTIDLYDETTPIVSIPDEELAFQIIEVSEKMNKNYLS